MDIISRLQSLEAGSEFRQWQKTHKNHYLVHAFKLLDEANKNIWQIGYYDKQSDTITTFVVEDDKEVKITPDLEIFKEEKHVIKKLDMKLVKINSQAALDTAAAFLKQKYPAETPLKTILLLQAIEQGQVYNISVITKSMSTINIKISSEDGTVLEDNKFSLNDLKAK